MPDRVLPAAIICRAFVITAAVSLSTSSSAFEVPQFGLASCFQAENPKGLAVSYTSLLAIATDPAFEKRLCQFDTEIPISGLFAHFVLPNGDWLVATRAGLYTFDPSGTVAPLDLVEAVGATGVALAPNSSAAVTTDDHIVIVDTEKGAIQRMLNVVGTDSPYFLPDGTLLVGHDEKVVQVSVETGQEIRTIIVGNQVNDISRRADGVIVVKTPEDIILYDEDLEEYARFAIGQNTHPCLRPRRSGSRC